MDSKKTNKSNFYSWVGNKGVLKIINGANRLLPADVITFLRSKIGAMASESTEPLGRTSRPE